MSSAMSIRVGTSLGWSSPSVYSSKSIASRNCTPASTRRPWDRHERVLYFWHFFAGTTVREPSMRAINRAVSQTQRRRKQNAHKRTKGPSRRRVNGLYRDRPYIKCSIHLCISSMSFLWYIYASRQCPSYQNQRYFVHQSVRRSVYFSLPLPLSDSCFIQCKSTRPKARAFFRRDDNVSNSQHDTCLQSSR